MTLYCPQCGYNLTGLPENRCPECGLEFDPEILKQNVLASRKGLDLDKAMMLLLWPPVAGVAVTAALGWIDDEAAIAAAAVSLCFILIYGAINSAQIARRMRPQSKDWTEPRRPRILQTALLTGGLYLIQLVVAFAGCAASVMIS